MTVEVMPLLKGFFPNDKVANFILCCYCRTNLSKTKIPPMSKSNGNGYLPKPDLSPLDSVTERLVSPPLLFMQLRRLRHKEHAIIGQEINVPVDTNTMMTSLPRQLDDDGALNVNIKK